jgi:hypothetical protein
MEMGLVTGRLIDVLDEPLQIAVSISDLLSGHLDVSGQVSVAYGLSPLGPGAKRIGTLLVVLDPMGD